MQDEYDEEPLDLSLRPGSPPPEDEMVNMSPSSRYNDALDELFDLLGQF